MGLEQYRKSSNGSELVSLPPVRIIDHAVFTDEENAYEGILPDSQKYNMCRQIRDFGEEVADPAAYYKESGQYVPYSRSRDSFVDKFTRGSRRCLIAVFLGLDRTDPSRPISEVYHIQPGLFSPDFNGELRRDDYEIKMLVLNNHIAVPESVQVVVAGGSVVPDHTEEFSEEMMPGNASKWLRRCTKNILKLRQ